MCTAPRPWTSLGLAHRRWDNSLRVAPSVHTDGEGSLIEGWDEASGPAVRVLAGSGAGVVPAIPDRVGFGHSFSVRRPGVAPEVATEAVLEVKALSGESGGSLLQGGGGWSCWLQGPWPSDEQGPPGELQGSIEDV